MVKRAWGSGLAMAGLAVCLGLGGNVSTAQTDAAKPRTSACRADVQKLCKGVQPGGGRIRDCLEHHSKMLSPDCQKELGERPKPDTPAAVGKAWGPACMLDASTFCKDIAPGGGQLRACLQRRMDALSPECKAALQPKKTN